VTLFICNANRFSENFNRWNQLAKLDHLQPAESQPYSIASSHPRAISGLRLNGVYIAKSQPSSIISSQPRASPTRSRPASREPFRLNHIQPAESQPSSIISSLPRASSVVNRPVRLTSPRIRTGRQLSVRPRDAADIWITDGDGRQGRPGTERCRPRRSSTDIHGPCSMYAIYT
jgi:hypothetical protein